MVGGNANHSLLERAEKVQANKMTLERARAFILGRQLLDGRLTAGSPSGALQAIRHLGYVQIDTINVVERAHHHTLWSRVPGYRPDHLDRLQKGRKIFEYWAHAMCYLPMEDYRFYRRHMVEFPDKSAWYRGFYKKYRRLAEEVLARIRDEGPLTAGDFEGPKNKQGGWWDWKPAKTALEMLFYRGDLMVAERRGFQRVYDLTERVLPRAKEEPIPSNEETKRFFAWRALSALGLATERDVGRHITIAGKLGPALSDMVERREARKIIIEGLPKPYFMLDELGHQLDSRLGSDDRVRLLSPFDNAVILRDRTQELFGMDYAMECYTPAVRRKYGYFSLPILWRNGLVGRLDPKADREKKTLLVRSLHLERPMPEQFFRELGRELGGYARFNGCGAVKLENLRSGPEKKLAKHL
jgi:hypothetical protein